MSDSIRQNKVARLIQRDMGDIFQKEMNGMFPGKIISVTVVRMSPDLSLAKIYLSIFPEKDPKEYLNLIRMQEKRLRNMLGKRVKNQLRIVPELAFFIDDSLDYTDRIDELLTN